MSEVDDADGQAAVRLEISADHGATAIGQVGQLNVASLSQAAIGNVDTFNLVLPPADRTATAVLTVGSMQATDTEFVGRAERISELGDFFRSVGGGPNMMVVSGPPGVGKTALVREAVGRLVAEGGSVRALFADLHGYDELRSDRMRPADLYASLLQGHGVPLEQIPQTTGDQATLYHRLLDERAQVGEGSLIWLDNVGDRSQIEGLIPANLAHRIVITTRETFPHSASHRAIELDLMPMDEALELLIRAIGDNGDDRISLDLEASRHLATLCDRLPLALRIVAALLSDEPSRPIREFAGELEEEAHRLDGLHYDERLSVRAAFGLSYKRLPGELQRLFRLLSQIPGGDIGLDAARWLIDAAAAATRPQLMALVRCHLVQQHIPNRWSMHDLIRIYAAEMATSDPADADGALRRIVERYGSA